MGLFSKLKKKSGESDNNEIYKKIFSSICNDAPAVMEEIEFCLENVKAYANKHEDYAGDMNIATAPEFALKWKICTSILAQNECICVFDDDVDFDDFYEKISILPDVSASGILPQADEIYLDYNIKSWLKCIDSKWSRIGMCIGAVDMKDDKYYIFVCSHTMLDNLIKQAEKVGRVIKRSSEL